MHALLRHGILVRSIVVTVAAFLVVGVATVAYTARSTGNLAEQAINTRMSQLLDTVQSTLRIACFLKDQDLAREVAQGLLSNTEVLSVTIVAGDDILASQQRKDAGIGTGTSPPAPLQRQIFSPFKAGEQVGEVHLTPNPQVIANQLRQDVNRAALQLGWQLALVSGVVVVTLLFLVIRPVSTMSRRLHAMQPTAGERLPVPPGHAGTEVGHLAEDINQLADDLVRALEEERGLRLQREMDERKYHAIFDNAESGIFIVDAEGTLSSWNPAFSRLLGMPRVEHHPGALKLAALPWEDPTPVPLLLERAFRDNAPVAAELPIRREDGSHLWLSVVLSPVGGDLLQGVVHDVSSLKEAEASARRQAITDPLTGLANRSGLEERLHNHVAQFTLTHAGGFALLLVDMDKFRQIVEGLGLPAGDQILRAVAERLTAPVKHNDTVARLAADIFAIVLPGLIDGEAVDRVAGRLMQSLRQPYFVDGSPIRLNASIGITLCPSDGTDVPSLLRHAELAVDKAKAAGGNTSVFFDPTLAEAAEQRRHLENDLRLAIRDHHFLLFFQPVVDLRDGRLIGAEALIRWRHPVRGLVAPDSFIPIAEQTGLINEIGLWVLDSACRQLLAWQQAGLDYLVSLNVSGRQIPDGLSPTALAETIRRHGIAPQKLALEITEGVLLNDIDKALAWLAAVHALGVRVYMDDFGTGFSSLSYLKRFPVDALKVDKSFVRDMQNNDSDRPLVAGIIAMARSLGLSVVAEGVEAPEHVRLLRDMGCQFAQGYHFSRPVPAEDFPAAAARIASLAAAGAPREAQSA
jgi:diguanylate cyclase (GGDEF)-like protein/PAS domain S-box-containing protein